MIVLPKYARRTAQWIVDSVMANGLAQQENEAPQEGSINVEIAMLARQAAAEGCVLLANDGTLPLSTNEGVAVFGRCQIDWFNMGYGSGGNVHPPYTTNLIDALSDLGATYNRVLAQMYRSWCASKEHEADHGWWGHWPTHHPEMPVDPELLQAAARTAYAAIVVIGRSAGEDLDMPLSPGGYYLTDKERALLDSVTNAFEHTVVILNTSNVIDLSWIEEYRGKLGAVVMAWQGGMEAGHAVADVLYGKVNPSGRLACSIARSYTDYPSSVTFNKRRQIDYREDIFVGYRHLDTFTPQAVLFPFGHGLSYTTFMLEIVGLELRDGQVTAQVSVTNTGTRAGRRAVLLWCQPPTEGLRKPARVLAAFGKTAILDPGASCVLNLACNIRDLAVYDTEASSFVLEAGSYQFDCTGTASIIDVPKRVVVEQCSSLCTTSDELRERILARMPSELTRAATKEDVRSSCKDVAFADVAQGKASLDDFVAQLSDGELESLTCGEGSMNSKLGTPGNAGAFGGVTSELQERGVPAVICADGPSGARLQRRCSLLPCATALACTWDTDLVQELYAQLGTEVRSNGIDVLLAPGMNIQRNPRCGRNFEYFSEDPLATGLMAAAVVKGLQSAGVSACPKHYACNNREARRNTSNSIVTERALREVYLRSFQICVREGNPDLIMTSYNKVNGVYAHYHYDLVTTVLRGEWGFSGVVVTDWWMKPAHSPEFEGVRDNAYRIRAGVDVLMPGSMSHVVDIKPKPEGVLRAELQRTARYVLRYLLRKA